MKRNNKIACLSVMIAATITVGSSAFAADCSTTVSKTVGNKAEIVLSNNLCGQNTSDIINQLCNQSSNCKTVTPDSVKQMIKNLKDCKKSDVVQNKGSNSSEYIKKIMEQLQQKNNCTTKPSKPVTPAQPVKPVTPAQPVTPSKPAAPSTGENTSTDQQAISQYAEKVVALVNEQRAKNGLSALTIDYTVAKGADIRATEIATTFSHTRPNGSSCFTALDEVSASYRGAGENIAKGQSTPEEVMNAWMNSDGHRANILNSSYTKIGVSYKMVNGSPCWVQLFTY